MKLDAGKLLVASTAIARSKAFLARQVVVLPNIFAYLLYILLVTGLFLWAPAFSVVKPMKPGFITNTDIAAYAFLALAFWGKSWQMRRFLVAARYSIREVIIFVSQLLYMSLFFMSALLCRRLRWGEIPITLVYQSDLLTLSYLGLAILALGVVILLKSSQVSLSDRLNLGYPFCLGMLLCMTGFPLALMAWLPLLALPGIFTLMVWRIGDIERRQEQPDLDLNIENSTLELLDEDEQPLAEPVLVVKPRFKILPWIY